jgi:competence protein ComGE
MLRRNEGFFLAELLLTLSAWLVIAGVFIPLMVHAVNQSVQLHKEAAATQALYELLVEARKESLIDSLHSRIAIAGSDFEVVQESRNGHDFMEVCIKYEDLLQKTYKKCEVFE